MRRVSISATTVGVKATAWVATAAMAAWMASSRRVQSSPSAAEVAVTASST